MDEELPPVDARELFEALREHEGPDVFGAVGRCRRTARGRLGLN
ncbi:hypothetical protein [Streptacidiphilus pinicola]|nr:hypothetical protein [Streptacidiphilus pinicola]